jgi:ketosteroid isomerase-like protein
LLDDRNAEELLELFAPGCTFEMMGMRLVGRDEIAAVWRGLGLPSKRPSTLHALTNAQIHIDGDTADAVSDWMMIDRGAEGAACQVAVAGRYYDRLVRDSSGAWRFVQRRAEALGRPR